MGVVPEGEDQVGVFLPGGFPGHDPQSPGHPQMDEQGPPGAQGEDDMFPPALDAADPFPLDPFAQGPPWPPKALIQADFHSGKFQLKNPGSQSPDDGFYFRQLGHYSSSPILSPGGSSLPFKPSGPLRVESPKKNCLSADYAEI